MNTKIKPGAIWEEMFRVRVNYFQAQTENHIKTFGVRISGVPELDKDIQNREIVTEMTIDTMFEHWRIRGLTITVLKYEDTKRIYDIIHRHLSAWIDHLDSAINIDNEPIQDLIDLDAFAQVVYDKAVPIIMEQSVVDRLQEGMTAIQEINFFNILKRRVPTTRKLEDGRFVMSHQEYEPPSRRSEPIRTSFKERLMEQLNDSDDWRN